MIEQGARVPDVAPPRLARHARESGDAAAAQQAKQDRFSLIVGVMGRRQRIRADPRRVRDEQCIARVAGALLDARVRLFTDPV